MDNLRIVLWTGGDAPDKEATLTVTRNYYGEYRFMAYWDDGYCGCPDCHCIIGSGPTEERAVADYWEQWSERYE